MKYHLDRKQASELIKLGFEANSSISPVNERSYETFTLSEMLDIIPKVIDGGFLLIANTGTLWGVTYNINLHFHEKELIDALYKAIVVLKERNLINN